MNAHEREVPPAGGFGSGPTSRDFGPTGKAPQMRLAPFVTAAVIIVTLGSVLMLLITVCHQYIANAKCAEARHELADMSMRAAAVYEERHRVCPSASQPIPIDSKHIAGKAYQSSRYESRVDAPNDAGFACLGWEMVGPQYYQYSYFATPTSFLARARGDLNDNGAMSDFMWTGDLKGDHLVIAPRAYERDIEE